MNNVSLDLDTTTFLTVIHNNYKRLFLDSSEAEAKTEFGKLMDDGRVPIIEISARDQGEVTCDLALDHSQFLGTLNFSRFRNALIAHLNQIADTLKSEDELNILTNQDTGDIVYYVPGIVEEDGTINVLVTGVEQRTAGRLTIRLMFLDPQQLSVRADQ